MTRIRALVCTENHAKPAVLYASFHTGPCVLPGSDFTRIDGRPTQIAAKSGPVKPSDVLALFRGEGALSRFAVTKSNRRTAPIGGVGLVGR